MNILHIHSFDKMGGAESVFNIARKNQFVGNNYSGYVKKSDDNEIPDISFEDWQTVSTIKGVMKYIYSFRNQSKVKDFLHNHDIDIVHLHGFYSTLSPSILKPLKEAKRKRNIRIIQTLHDFHLVCPNGSLFNYSTNKICEKCLGHSLKCSMFVVNCDRRGYIHSCIKGIRSFISNNLLHHRDVIDLFIAPSNFLKKKLIEDKVNEIKIRTVRNPLTKTELHLSEMKENIICYFGRFSREKNLEFLIRSFSHFKQRNENNFRLLLIGEGEEESFLKKEAAESGFGEEIIFKKFMPLNELMETVRRCKIFSLTSRCFENAPLSVIEALSTGIIPIVPNIGGMEETLNLFGVGRTYRSEDINSWQENLENILDNYENEADKLKTLIQNKLQKYSVENYHKELFEVYKELLR